MTATATVFLWLTHTPAGYHCVHMLLESAIEVRVTLNDILCWSVWQSDVKAPTSMEAQCSGATQDQDQEKTKQQVVQLATA